VPRLQLGERAFEIVMARKRATGELQTAWFERHGSMPITELPAHWPQPYRELVQCRIALMESDRNIALIEQPEYKRRWNVEPWDEQLERALREWLLNRLEGYFLGGERMIERGTGNAVGGTADGLAAIRAHWPAGQQPALVSTNQLAAVVETDADFLRVAEIYSGGPGFSVSKLVRELVEAESVPFLPFQRYKDTGLRKRQDWEHVWELQRKEDEFDAKIEPAQKEFEELTQKLMREPKSPDVGKWNERRDALSDSLEFLREDKKKTIGTIPVPPKYASGDFKKSNWWKLRGKLDVPKERWIIYPGAERAADPSPVIAWAGWDHAQQAQALAAYYIDAGQNQGWSPEKLRPLLAGLAELQPWLKQWHNTFNPDFSSGLGDYFASFLDEEARKQGATVAALNEMRFGVEMRETKQAVVAAPTKSNEGIDTSARVKSKSPEAPEFASFAEAYPSNAADKFVCALALEIIAWRDTVESNDHLDALILATHPDLCRILMTNGSTSQLDSWAASLKSELKTIQSKGLKWVQCVNYLEEHRNALAIGRDEAGRPIRAGANFDSTRQSFPCQQSAMAAFALGLLDSIRERRQSGSLSTEQTEAFETIEELHSQYAIV
jgi:hypothetical protein